MRILWLCSLLSLLTAGCLNRFDSRQVPVITVSEGLHPVITWTPPDAFELHVYEGAEDGDGLGALWTARMGGDFANTLQSPVTYGVPPEGSEVRPAEPLVRGQTYSVTVFRTDPKGSGDGFFNTRHRYLGKLTFVATGDE